jgi:hypothetical protein
MKRISIAVAALALMVNVLACCCVAPPDIQLPVQRVIDIGPLQEKDETVPLNGAESANVDIFFGAGELDISATDSDDLFVGNFVYNVEAWEPKITWDGDSLRIEQGGDEDAWGWPDGSSSPRNEWKLEFSPEVLLDIDVKAGAGEGDLDLTGLRLEQLNVDMGAGDFSVQFDEASDTKMERLTVNAGAGKIDIDGIGNVSPQEVVVQGGAGDITLDLTGEWSRSADIEVTAGVGSLALRLPADVGVRVDVEGGLSSVSASGLTKSGGEYVNDIYGDTDIELAVKITAGIGDISLRIVE